MEDSKASKLRPPSKIGRPCCTVPPKPGLPPSSPKSNMNSMDSPWESHGRRQSEVGLRRGSDTSVVLTDDTDSFIIGDRVWVGGTKPGCIAYIGETQFAPGDWAGVVLEEPIGKNDGSVAGSRYFQCEPKRGIFSRLTRLTRQPLANMSVMSPSREKTPTSPIDSPRLGLNKSMSPSLNASTTSLASVSHKDLKIGDRVIVSSSQGSKTGVLRFMGLTEFANGEWCGVELDDPIGKNDGSVDEIRYFECRPKHGLFAPLHKVSRSPSSRRTSTMCAMHKPSGASTNLSKRRIGGSRESLASMSSVASTIASGTTQRTTSGSRRPGLRTSTPARSSVQEMLKEKQQEIDMLRKERDFERDRISKAATQAHNAEKTVMTLKEEYDKYRDDMEQTVREAQESLTQLLEEKNVLKIHLDEERQKNEDLLFRFEEESVNKDDIQVMSTLNQSKLTELEDRLRQERERVIQLEHDNTKLFEAEEEIIKLRSQLSAALSYEKDLEDIRNRNMCLEEAKITLEKQVLERNDSIELLKNQIKELEMKFGKLEEERVARLSVESNMQKSSDEIQQCLVEKCSLIEKMKTDHEYESETFKKEIDRLEKVIDSIIKEHEKKVESLAEAHRKSLDEKEKTINSKTVDQTAELERHNVMHKSALEKLREDNIKHIQELEDNFGKQLAEKDRQITEIVNQLEDRTNQIQKLVKNLEELQTVSLAKEEEATKILQRYEELRGKIALSQEENTLLATQVSELRLRNEETSSSFAQEKEKLEESVTSLRASSGELSAQLEKLNNDLENKEKELSDLRNARDAEIRDLKNSFDSQIGDKTKYITEITAEMSETSLRLSALEKQIAELNEIIANKDEEIKNLLTKTAEFQDAITLSEQTKSNLESELRMYDVNIAELNMKVARAEEKTVQLTDQKMAMEAEIANVMSTSSNSSDQLVKYSESLREKEKELDQLREQLFQSENSLSVTNAKLNGTLEEHNKTSKILEKLSIETEELKKELAANLKTKDQLVSEIDDLKVEKLNLLEAVKNKEILDNELKSKTDEISKLTEDLEKTSKDIVSLKEKYVLLETESSAKETELKKVSENLEKELLSIQEEWQRSQKTSENLATERSELVKSINILEEKFNSEIEEKKKLETIVMEKNAAMEKLELNIDVFKKEKDEAIQALQESNEKYNESLKKLALLNSSLENVETQNTLELTNVRQKLAQTESTCKEVTARLLEHENCEKELNAKLSEYEKILKVKEDENRELSTNLENAKTLVENTKCLADNCEKEFRKNLEERIRENSELRDQLDILTAKMSKAQSELDSKIEIVKQSKNEMLENKIQELEDLRKVKEEELENARKLAIAVQEQNKNLQDELVVSNSECIAKDKLCQEMRKEIALLRDTCASANKSEEPVKEIPPTKFVELNKEKKLKTKIEKMDSLSSLRREKEESVIENEMNLEDKLNLEKTGVTRLKENQIGREMEKKQLSGRLNQAPEDLKACNDRKKNNQDIENNPINQMFDIAGEDINQNSDREEKVTKLMEELEMSKGQIDFLNSVIVEMQRKNETLLCKIEVLEMGVPANEADDYSRTTLDKRTSAPRMFCDICDQFDLHETEDCPRQDQDFTEPEKPKKPAVDRPYCENCEVFGHDTLNCDDAETF